MYTLNGSTMQSQVLRHLHEEAGKSRHLCKVGYASQETALTQYMGQAYLQPVHASAASCYRKHTCERFYKVLRYMVIFDDPLNGFGKVLWKRLKTNPFH